MSDLSALAEPIYDIPEQDEFEDELAMDVRNDFIEAERYKRQAGVEERFLRALRARRQEYDPEDRGLVGGIDIYIGLVALKCRSAEAWINDIVLNSIDKPWTLKATPIPSLPEWMKDQVVDALELELQQLGASMNVRKRAKELKDAAYKYTVQKAAEAVGNMERKIEDQLLEGGWRPVFAEFVQDLTTFPGAVIRSPIIYKKKKLSWENNKLVEKETTVFGMRRVSGFDAFPSLDSTDCQNGSYFIERYSAQPTQLYMCLGLEDAGFNDEAIREVLDKYGETGFDEILQSDSQRKHLEDRYQPEDDRKTIDILIRNGKILGKKLLKYNIAVPDPQAYYESEIWTVNNKTIRAVLNPYPLQERPLFSTSFIKVPGSFWGEGLADVLRDLQRMLNSSARSIVRNMSFSSGPLGEVDVARLGDGEIPNELIPYKLFHVDADPMGSGKPAFSFYTVPHVAPQMRELMEYFIKLADDLSGIPSYVLGNPQVAGAGRTLGGLSMLMGNAAKGIKNVILNVDRDTIEPIVTMQYNINMKYDEDPSIKGDAQVLARGATGLLQRELSQARLIEVLQSLTPFVQMGVIQKQGTEYLLRETFKNTGLDIDKIIPDPDRPAQIQAGLQQLGLSSMTPGMQGPPVSLDGRSVPPPFPQQVVPSQSPGLTPPGAAAGFTPLGGNNATNPFPMPANLPQGA